MEVFVSNADTIRKDAIAIIAKKGTIMIAPNQSVTERRVKVRRAGSVADRGPRGFCFCRDSYDVSEAKL